MVVSQLLDSECRFELFSPFLLLGDAGKTGEAIKAEEQQAMRKESVKMETLETAGEAAASAGNLGASSALAVINFFSYYFGFSM